MSDDNTQAEAAPSEQEALAAAQVGYAKVRGLEPPAAATSTETQDSASSGDDLSAGSDGAPAKTEAAAATPEPTAAPAPAEPTVADELASLKQKVRDMEAGGASAQEVRRLHGEIGNLNRAIKALQTKEASAGEDELAAALTQAETVANEYPELGGPLVKALKLLSTRQAAQPVADAPAQAVPSEPSEKSTESQFTPEQRAAIAAIDAVHPDRHQVKSSPEFQAWFAKQPTNYQMSVRTTWNAAVLTDCLTKFKAHRSAEEATASARAAQLEADRKRKQERLAANESPQGVPTKASSTTLPDEAGFERGYARAKRHRHF